MTRPGTKLIILGCLVVLLYGLATWYFSRLYQTYTHTTGTILSITSVPSHYRRSIHYVPLVEVSFIKRTGEKITFKQTNPFSDIFVDTLYSAGDPIRVAYNPQTNEAVIDSFVARYSWFVLAVVLGPIFIFIGVVNNAQNRQV